MNELVCFGCKQEFNTGVHQPLILPSCGHTVCKSCIEGWLEQTPDRVACPEDGKEFMLDAAEGVNAFPKNISLGRLLTEKSKAEEPPPPLSAEPETQDPAFCRSHKKVADLICITDEKVICADCVLFGEHKSHDYKRGIEFMKEAQKKFEANTVELEALKHNPLIAESDRKLSELRDKIRARQDELNTKLADHFEQLHAKLRDVERGVQEELTSKIKSAGSRITTFENQLRRLGEKEAQISEKWAVIRDHLASKTPDFAFIISNLRGSSDHINSIADLVTETRSLEHDFSEISISHINSVGLSSNLPQALLSLEKSCHIEVMKSRTTSPMPVHRSSMNYVEKKHSLVAERPALETNIYQTALADTQEGDEQEDLMDDRDFNNLADTGNFESSGYGPKSKPLVWGVRPSSGSDLVYSKGEPISGNFFHGGEKRISGIYQPITKLSDPVFNKPLVPNLSSKREFLNESSENGTRISKPQMNYSLNQPFAVKDFGGQGGYGALPPPRPPVPKINVTPNRVSQQDQGNSILKSLKEVETKGRKEDELVNFSDMHMNDAKFLNALNELGKNKRMKKLLLDNNKITEAGFDAFLKKLGAHETLERVSMINNLLDDNVFPKLEEAALKLKTLRVFVLTGNKNIKMTAKAKKIHANLKKLGFTVEV